MESVIKDSTTTKKQQDWAEYNDEPQETHNLL